MHPGVREPLARVPRRRERHGRARGADRPPLARGVPPPVLSVALFARGTESQPLALDQAAQLDAAPVRSRGQPSLALAVCASHCRRRRGRARHPHQLWYTP